MKFMCLTAGYTKWDLKRKEDVLKELKVEPILDYICRNQNNLRQHVNRMSRTRISKANNVLPTKGQEINRTPNEEVT
jgi:hypothetical protein